MWLFSLKFHWKLIPNFNWQHNRALVQIMAWCRMGDKPLPEPIVAWSTDAYMRYSYPMSWNKCHRLKIVGCIGLILMWPMRQMVLKKGISGCVISLISVLFFDYQYRLVLKLSTSSVKGFKNINDEFVIWYGNAFRITGSFPTTSLHKGSVIRRLTHWGWATHICVGKLTTIGSDNGLAPGRRQAIIWTNAGILLIGPLGTNFSEILIGIQTFSFKKMHLKMSSAKWRPFVSASMS